MPRLEFYYGSRYAGSWYSYHRGTVRSGVGAMDRRYPSISRLMRIINTSVQFHPRMAKGFA
eukprot:scaffold7474_cov19-Prasinocladus_malaysianus.AAC.1